MTKWNKILTRNRPIDTGKQSNQDQTRNLNLSEYICTCLPEFNLLTLPIILKTTISLFFICLVFFFTKISFAYRFQYAVTDCLNLTKQRQYVNFPLVQTQSKALVSLIVRMVAEGLRSLGATLLYSISKT